MATLILRPIADGTPVDCSVSPGGTDHYTLVNEVTPNDSTYVYTDGVSGFPDERTDRYDLETTPLSGYPINSVKVYFRGVVDGSKDLGTHTIRPFLYSGVSATSSNGASYSFNTTPTTINRTLTAPGGGSWSWDLINCLQVGYVVFSESAATTLRQTRLLQSYVEVDFTPDTYSGLHYTDAITKKTTGIYEAALSGLNDPLTHSDHYLHVRCKKENESDSGTIVAKLLQGNTEIVSSGIQPTINFITYSIPLTLDQAAQITDYSNLSVSAVGEVYDTSNFTPQISWMAFETAEVTPPLSTDHTSDTVLIKFSDIYSASLDTLQDPGVDTGHVLRVRARKQNSVEDGYLIVNLKQGSTLIESYTINSLTTAFTTFEQTLQENNVANITDYSDLSVEIQAVTQDDDGLTAEISWIDWNIPAAASTSTEHSTDTTLVDSGSAVVYSDVVAFKRNSATVKTDTVLVTTETTVTYTDTFLFKREASVNYTDTLLVDTTSAVVYTDVLLSDVANAEHYTDTQLKNTDSATSTTDTQLVDTTSAVVYTDVFLTDKALVQHSLDVHLAGVSKPLHYTDSTQYKQLDVNVYTDVFLYKTYTATVNTDVTLNGTSYAEGYTDVYLLAQNTNTVVSYTDTQVTDTSNVYNYLDIYVYAGIQSTHRTDVYLTKTETRNVTHTLDVVYNNSKQVQTYVDVALASVNSAENYLDLYIKSVTTSQHTVDTIINHQFAAELSTDVFTYAGTRTKSHSTDIYILYEGFQPMKPLMIV